MLPSGTADELCLQRNIPCKTAIANGYTAQCFEICCQVARRMMFVCVAVTPHKLARYSMYAIELTFFGDIWLHFGDILPRYLRSDDVCSRGSDCTQISALLNIQYSCYSMYAIELTLFGDILLVGLRMICVRAAVA